MCLLNREMGIFIKRKIWISIGMKEYPWMCVFMIYANETKGKDGENKSTGDKSYGMPLSSSPKKLLHVSTHEVCDFLT
jgi:hypothetical protein